MVHFWSILISSRFRSTLKWVPLNSCAGSTRSSFNFFSTENMMMELRPVQAMMAMRPITFQARPSAASEDPLKNRPPHLNKQTARVPQIPPAPCTGMASRGSSILKKHRGNWKISVSYSHKLYWKMYQEQTTVHTTVTQYGILQVSLSILL